MLPFLPLQAPVLLEHRVATVAAVVAELGRKTGQDLRMRRELGDEVLYVNLKARPADDLRRLIARAASAEWTLDGGHVWLERSASLRRRQGREDRATFGEAALRRLRPMLDPDDAKAWGAGEGWLGRAAKAVAGMPANDAAGAMRQEARRRAATPAGRLLSRMARALTAADLGAVPPGGIARFALRPNRRQRPLAGATAASVTQYARERAAASAEMEGMSEEDRSRGERDLRLFGLETVAKGTLSALLVARREATDGLSLQVLVVDGEGRTIDKASLSLHTGEEEPARGWPRYAAWRDAPIKVGPVCASFVRGIGGEGHPDPASAALLRDPVAHEPLAALMTDPMDALAEATGHEAVVALPDECGLGAGAQLERSPKLGEFANGLAQADAVEEADGLLVGHALRPSEATFAKTSRAALRDLMRLLADRPPRLDDLVRYAQAQNPESTLTLFEPLVLAGADVRVTPDLLGPVFDTPYGGRDALRLYGALSPVQRAAILAGGAVTFDQLSPAGRASADSLVFERTRDLERNAPPSRVEEVDPTLCVDGLSMATTVTATDLVTEPVALSTWEGTARVNDASSLGYILSQQEAGERFGRESGYPLVATDRFVPGVKRSFRLTVRPAPGLRSRVGLWDVDLDPKGRAVPYAELPAEHLGALRKTLEYYRKLRKG